MTPEEILSECPELEYMQPLKQDKAYGTNTFSYTGCMVPVNIAHSLSKSRKEARELREQNKHLQGQLKYFTGGPVNG